MAELRLIPLGGMGEITQNMFVYRYQNEILIVDCGIGFPDVYMPGVDAIVPDISYLIGLLNQGKKIVGMILSHGHDDHIAALPYLLPGLPEFPIYASSLTAGFAEQRMADGETRRPVKVVPDKQWLSLGNHFKFQLIAVTHSVPDTKHLLIDTPEGMIYHGSDFKLDPNPVDGVKTDLDQITKIGQDNVQLMLLDCLRVEQREWTKSESTVGPVIEAQMRDTKGKFLITLMSSHVHRIQQVVEAARELKRKLVFVGRSVEQNVKVARKLKKLHIPKSLLVDKRNLSDYPDHKLCVVIAGSQGQEGSSLVRAAFGEHRIVKITPDDKVLFSADAIPGNEVSYYNAIDELARNNVDVIYPDVVEGLHQSGHASTPEQQELLNLVKPKFIMPIGGADRHRVKFREFVAQPAGYSKKRVLIPKDGEIISISQGNYHIADKIRLNPSIIDGLGIGDVGPVVLSDRRSLSEAGIIVIVIPRNRRRVDFSNIMVVSRGFVFMKQADEVVDFIKETTIKIIRKAGKKIADDELKKLIEKRLSRKLYKIIQREPMIVPVMLDI